MYVVKPTIPVEEPERPGAPLVLGEKKESQKEEEPASDEIPPP